MIAGIAVWIIVSLCAPWAMSDKNKFLNDFVGPNLLGFLGVVVTITLASAANVHFELNKLEEKAGKVGFAKSRLALRRSSSALIGLLLLAVAVLLLKSNLPAGETAQSLANGAAVLIVLFNVLVLIDLTQMAFKIGPDLKG
jgi:hypothetical protein